MKKLNNWEYLSEYASLKKENVLFNIELKWKKSTILYNYNDLNCDFEQKQIIWPTELKWKVILIIIVFIFIKLHFIYIHFNYSKTFRIRICFNLI